MPEDIAGKDQQQGYSSLRQAVDRILGFTPGGQAGGQDSGIQMGSRAPVSNLSDLSNPANTSSNITSAPAVQPAAAPVYNQYNQTRYSAGTTQNPTLEVGTAGGKYVPVSSSNLYDSQVKAQLDRSMADYKANPDNAYLGEASNYISGLYNPGKSAIPSIPGGTASASATAPVRPAGRNVSWQQDQQYWRDLDNYNKANKLGTYK